MDELIKVHIWQLPEKSNDINKSNEYVIIHDGYTKKITVERLFEYFNQDYKMDNIVRYFDEIIYSTNNEYEPQYSTLEISLGMYQKLVEELKEKFTINRNKIRELESISSKLDVDSDGILLAFGDIDKKRNVLLTTFNDFETIISNMQVVNTEELRNNTSELIDDISQLYIDSGNIKDQASDIRNEIDSSVTDKKEILLKNITDEYDKILAIVDYYHHIHDPVL